MTAAAATLFAGCTNDTPENPDDNPHEGDGEYTLLYTSTDGRTVTPYDPDAFGAAMVSNTCENGTGTMVFDGPVSKIGDNAFRGRANLAGITIPDTVAEMGFDAFSDCPNLSEIHVSDLSVWLGIRRNVWIDSEYSLFVGGEPVTDLVIPDGVASIDRCAFQWCAGLESVTIPGGITEIGENAFRDCPNLKEFRISDLPAWLGIDFDSSWTMSEYSLLVGGEPVTDLVIPDGVTSIGSSEFQWCAGLESVTIPAGVTEIGEYAFFACFNMDEIHVPDLTAWCNIRFGEMWSAARYRLFIDGTPVTELVIPDGVTKVGDYMFSYCSGIAEVTIPDSVTEIGRDAFYAAEIGRIAIPESVTTIVDNAFSSCSGLTGITIPASVTEMGRFAFYGCKDLESVKIGDGMTSIPESAFGSCKVLADVTIPGSVTSIGASAFGQCAGLREITIPDSVTSIGDEAFWNCMRMKSITLSSGLMEIGVDALSCCYALESIYCRAAVPPTLGGEGIIDAPSELKIYVPRASVEAYESAPYWKDYAIIGYDF